MNGMTIKFAAVSAGVIGAAAHAQTTVEWLVLSLQEQKGGQSRVLSQHPFPSDEYRVVGQSFTTTGAERAAMWAMDDKHDPSDPIPLTLLPDVGFGDSAAIRSSSAFSAIGVETEVVAAGWTTDSLGNMEPCIWSSSDGINFVQTLLDPEEEGAAQAIVIASKDDPSDLAIGGYVIAKGLQQAVVWEVFEGPEGGGKTWQQEMLPAPTLSGSQVITAAGMPLGGFITTPGGAQRAAFWEKDDSGKWELILPMIPQPTDFDASRIIAMADFTQGKETALARWTSPLHEGVIGVMTFQQFGAQWEFPVSGQGGVPALAVRGLLVADAFGGARVVGSVVDTASVPNGPGGGIAVAAWSNYETGPFFELEPIVPASLLPDFAESAAVGGVEIPSSIEGPGPTGQILIAGTGTHLNGEEHGFVLLGTPGSGSSSCPEDLDDTGEVGFADLLQVLAAWGTCD